MTNFTISKVEPNIQANANSSTISGIQVSGTATKGQSVSVVLKVPANDVVTSAITTQSDSSGQWSVSFGDQYDPGITVYGRPKA